MTGLKLDIEDPSVRIMLNSADANCYNYNTRLRTMVISVCISGSLNSIFHVWILKEVPTIVLLVPEVSSLQACPSYLDP